MKLPTRFFLCLTMLIFASCDPALLLTVKVDNKNTQSIILFTDKRILPFNHDNDSSKFIIQVPYNDSIIKTFNYGIGAWSNESIIELTKIIDSIYINDGKNENLNKEIRYGKLSA